MDTFVLAVVGVSLAVILGASGGMPPWLLGAGLLAVGTTGFLISEPVKLLWYRTGALAVAMVAAGSGALGGYGSLELSGLTGAIVLIAFPFRRPTRFRLPSILFGVASLIIILWVLVPLIVDGGPLGHDESAYALKARSWLSGTPDSGWGPHRGLGLSWYAYPVLQAGGAEAGLRIFGLLGTLGLALAVWRLGSLSSGATVGAVSALVLIASPSLLRRGTEFLSDIPSAALLVSVAAILWKQLEIRGQASLRLLWIAPIALAAFYIRYQSILSLGLILVVAVGIWWKELRANLAPVIWLGVVGFLGLIPHFMFASHLTGKPWGIITGTSDAVRAYVGEGLVDYILLSPWALAGYVGIPLVILAFWWCANVWKRGDKHSRLARLIFIPALVQIFVLGVLSHGEPRFIFFPISLITIAGVHGGVHLSRKLRPEKKHAFVSAGLLLLFGGIAASTGTVRGSVLGRSLNNESVMVASEMVEDFSNNASCDVLTSYLPQVTFYSECETHAFPSGASAIQLMDTLTGDKRFMILVEDGKRQPTEEVIAEIRESSVEDPVKVEVERADAEIYRFAPRSGQGSDG
ncbi:MAG: hypothetical protein WED83_06370 [Acidimicrobiia bacterium]